MGWVDADFAGDLVSRRSSSGLVLLFGKTLPRNVFVGGGTNWAFFWRIRVLRLCERKSSVAGNAVIDAGLGELSQVDSENSNGLQCTQEFRDQARSGAPETRLHSFPMVARQKWEQGRVESCESWHSETNWLTS